MISTKKISIPARGDNAPATELFVKIVSKNPENLKSRPYLFVLPGGPGFNHSNYKDYECLQDVANVVFHDPRGCGLSDKNDPATYTMDNYIDDVEEIRKALDLKKIQVIGKSYGANCAIGYALRYPDVLDSLVLAAGATSHRFLDLAKENLKKRKLTLEQAKWCEKLWAGSFASNDEVIEYLKSMSGEYSWRIRNNLPVNRPASDYPCAYEVLNQGFGGFMRTFDFENQLDQIKCPTCILVGEEDWITDKSLSELMKEKIPNSKLTVFPKSDHSMESDVPDLFFAAIKSFLFLQNKQEKKLGPIFFQLPGSSVVTQITPPEVDTKATVSIAMKP